MSSKIPGMKNVLVHRYNNRPDILAVGRNGCSDVNRRTEDDDFDYVLVIPTLEARYGRAVLARAASRQYAPTEPRDWPGMPGEYQVRVDVEDVVYIDLETAKRALINAGVIWAAQWQVTTAIIDIDSIA